MKKLKLICKVSCALVLALVALSVCDVLWGPQHLAYIELETGSVAVQVSADKAAAVDVDVVLF